MDESLNAVNSEVAEQESTVAESAPAETNTPEVDDDALLKLLSEDGESSSSEDATEEQPVKEDSQDEEPSDKSADETPKEQPLGEEKPLAEKSENRFQKLANENKQLKQMVEQLNAQVYQPQTVEDLVVNEGLSEEMAEVRQLKQQLELNDYNNRVIEAQTNIGNESAQILQDMPIFNPDSPEFDADLHAQAAETLQASLIYDPNTGQIIGSHLSPYQIYKPIAEAHRKSQLRGQLQGQKARETMLSNVDAPSSSAPKATKEDPLMQILRSDD